VSAIPYLIATYLVASISGPQLIARMHGVDLHRVGTRNLGGGNLARNVGSLAGLTGGLIDALKPPLAMLLARAFGADATTEVACGVVAIVAQQWPLWHRFDGGRGNAPMFALLIALSLPAAALASIFVFGGLALAQRERRRNTIWTVGTPVGILLGFLLYPLIAAAVGAGPHVVAASAIAVALVIVRRLTAGVREDLELTDDLGRVLLNRLLYDRSESQVHVPE
jgi:glycerol-3-phosphate acyltransferase PlsY